jgi:hypothetical protein
VKRLCAFIFLAAAFSDALAASLHEQPIGTRVPATFELGPKHIYAPAGDWTLIASHSWTGTMDAVLQGPSFAGVYLVEVKDGRWLRALQAVTNIEPSFKGWRHNVDPCKPRATALAHRDLSRHFNDQFCFDVTELRGFMRNSTAWRRNAQQWLADHQVKLPESVLMMRFVKLDRTFWTEVFYYFDPADLDGGSRAQQVDAAVAWGQRVAGQIRAGLSRPGP